LRMVHVPRVRIPERTLQDENTGDGRSRRGKAHSSHGTGISADDQSIVLITITDIRLSLIVFFRQFTKQCSLCYQGSLFYLCLQTLPCIARRSKARWMAISGMPSPVMKP